MAPLLPAPTAPPRATLEPAGNLRVFGGIVCVQWATLPYAAYHLPVLTKKKDTTFDSSTIFNIQPPL